MQKKASDLVWKTHDFILEDLVERESSFEFMFKDLEEIIELYKVNLIYPEALKDVILNYTNSCEILINLYSKHNQVLKEMGEIIKKGQEPAGGKINTSAIADMIESNNELKESVRESILMLRAVENKLINDFD